MLCGAGKAFDEASAARTSERRGRAGNLEELRGREGATEESGEDSMIVRPVAPGDRRLWEPLWALVAPRLYWHTAETNATAMRLYDRVAERPGFVVYRKQL